MIGIYRYTNRINGKSYIGKSTNIEQRKNGHLRKTKNGDTTYFHNALRKYGENGGLCLTYTDASTVETVSYDHTESGWAYNSTDKTNIAG